MAQVVVKGLSQYGVITDVPSFETPINAWSEIRNCSFTDGGISKSGTRLQVLVPSVDNVNKIYNKDGFIYYSTPTKLYQNNGKVNIDVSRASGSYLTNTEWYTAELSNVIIFSNESNVPQMFKPSDTKFSDLTAWGTESGSSHSWRTKKIRAYKNFLIAIGMQEDGVEYPQRIRWSDLALPNTVPTSWDASDTTKSAGFNDLSEAKGDLVDAIQMGDYLILYTTQEVYLMTYVGGNDIFSFRKIFDELSILAPECAVQVNGGHFLVTSSDVVIHNGSTWQSVVENKIKDQLYNAISAASNNKVKVQNYPAKQEVWILYPSTATAVLDRAAIFSLTTNTWTFRELPNVTAISYGRLPSDDDLIYDYQNYTFDSLNQVNLDPYNGIGQDFVRNSLFVSTKENIWWAVDEGSGGTVYLPSVAVKNYIDFDDYGIEATSHKMIRSVYPQIKGDGIVNISIGVSENPYDAPSWSNAVPFNIATDRKADFRVSGRYISIRFESFGQENWNMTSFAIDAVQRGTR